MQERCIYKDEFDVAFEHFFESHVATVESWFQSLPTLKAVAAEAVCRLKAVVGRNLSRRECQDVTSKICFLAGHLIEMDPAFVFSAGIQAELSQDLAN